MDTIEPLLKEVADEVRRAAEMWGTDFDDRNTPNDWAVYCMIQLANACGMDYNDPRFDSKKFREAMKKTAGLAISAIRALDRNDQMPLRHYDTGVK
jgi:hypothetical protein